jgi:hypothetical protein
MKTEKKNFVSYYLSPMLRKADNKIYSAEYDTDDSGNEFVTVTYINGYKRLFTSRATA